MRFAHALLISTVSLLMMAGCMSTVPLSERTWQDVEQHQQTQDVAFERTMRWVAQSYGSADDVVQLSDKDQGTIVLKGIYDANRAGVDIPTNYTLTIDVRDEKARFKYRVGEPVEPGTNGPMKYEMDDLESNYRNLKSSILTAIDEEDDF